MANEFRINYVLQMNAFRDLKLEIPGLTAGMVSVYYALLEINNQSQWSEEFDVDFGYMMALSKVDKTTYYKAMEFFMNNDIISKHTKGVNAYTRARVTLCLLYEKSLGNSLGNQEGISLGNSPAEQVSDHHYIETLNNKLKKETIKVLFDEFWIIYDKKIGKDKTIKKWNQLTDSDREEITKSLPAYVQSTPDKKFRKDPLTYLNGSHWKDEIISAKDSKTIDLVQGFKLGQKPKGSVHHGQEN